MSYSKHWRTAHSLHYLWAIHRNIDKKPRKGGCLMLVEIFFPYQKNLKVQKCLKKNPEVQTQGLGISSHLLLSWCQVNTHILDSFGPGPRLRGRSPCPQVAPALWFREETSKGKTTKNGLLPSTVSPKDTSVTSSYKEFEN